MVRVMVQRGHHTKIFGWAKSLHLLSHSLPCTFPPFRSRPLNLARGLGECCMLPQRGQGPSCRADLEQGENVGRIYRVPTDWSVCGAIIRTLRIYGSAYRHARDCIRIYPVDVMDLRGCPMYLQICIRNLLICIQTCKAAYEFIP